MPRKAEIKLELTGPQQVACFEAHRDLAEKAARDIGDRQGYLNGMDYEDYRQEALMGLCDGIARNRRPEHVSLRAYLYQRCKRAVLDGIRRWDELSRNQRAEGIKGPKFSLDHPLFGTDADRAVPLGALIESPRKADRDTVADAAEKLFFGLPATVRAILYLWFVYATPDRRIADILGLPPTAVTAMRKHAVEFIRGRRSPLAARGPAGRRAARKGGRKC